MGTRHGRCQEGPSSHVERAGPRRVKVVCPVSQECREGWRQARGGEAMDPALTRETVRLFQIVQFKGLGRCCAGGTGGLE